MTPFDEKLKDTQKRKLKATSIAQNLYEIGKLPPQATDLEEAVLGALMLDKDALSTVIDILKPESFYKEAHGRIFQAIQRLFERSEPIDILTVTQELKKSGELEIIGGAYYITQLTNRVASAANAEFHARIISQKHIQRELIRISTDTIKNAYEDTSDVFDMLDAAESNLFKIAQGTIRKSYDKMSTLISSAIKQIEEARKNKGGVTGIPSGFTELDRVTNGWQKSDLIIMAARPGMGKTAFVLSLARNVAIDFGKPVAFFSLEMSSIQLVNRLISSEIEIDSDKLKKGNLEQYEFEQLNAKIGKLAEAALLLDYTPARSVFELRAKARRLVAQNGVQLIIVDYLQLMTTGTENRGNREQEISYISRSLKSIAKELNVPIIALSQLSRAPETRGGTGRPILSDLRESGAIEQDADLVMFIYRPEYYKIDTLEDGTPTGGLAEILVSKHRNGATGDVRLRFVDRLSKFVDFDAVSNTISSGENAVDLSEPRTTTRPSKMNDIEDETEPF